MPTELPKREPPPHASTSPHNIGSLGGDKDGMERLEGESEASYVARQRSLQEAARVSLGLEKKSKKKCFLQFCFLLILAELYNMEEG